MAWLEAHPHAVDLGPGLAEQRETFVVVADVQPHLGQDTVGGCFDLLQVLLAHDVVGRDLAADIGRAAGLGIGVAPFPATAAAMLPGIRITHGWVFRWFASNCLLG